MSDNHNWYEKSFNAEYLAVYSHRDDQSAHKEAQWVLQHMGLPKTSTVLDLCCGNGRHSEALTKLGMTVTGFDLSQPLLTEASDRCVPGLTLVRGDMRDLPFESASFDGVTSFFTSFGYFQKDQENIQVIKEVARILKPQGQFFFDFLNHQYVRDTLVPESIDEKDGSKLIQTRTISSDDLRVEKTIRFLRSDGTEDTFHESVRLFTKEELLAIFNECGLRVNASFGSLDGDAPSSKLPRTAMFATLV